MDYTQLLHELQQASLFDLYRLQAGIGKMLDQPERIQAIKRRLRPDMQVTYFDERENRLIPAVVEEIQRTRLAVRNKEDGRRWSIRFCMINLDGVDTDIHASQGQVDRNKLKVGDTVGFHDRQQREQYGQIVRLNQKTVTIHTKVGTKWRVAYSFLFKVMDGEGGQVPDPGLIEGEVVEADGHEVTLEPESVTKSGPAPGIWEKHADKADGSTSGTASQPSQKVGRNSPCPCGSGRKFKRCCLGKS